jgi:ketosteroid isomerase-like protein
MFPRFLRPLLFVVPLAFAAANLTAQKPASTLPAPGTSPFHLIPIQPPELTAGELKLLTLEGQFAESVKAGGGKAFVTWFAEDAVILNNGKPAIRGRGALALQADWDPKVYQLIWVATGAQMSPSGDMGFTWGDLETKLTPPGGTTTTTYARYITVWRKQADGSWKVALDASQDRPPLPFGPGAVAPPQP